MRQGQAALVVVALWLVMGASGPAMGEQLWDVGCLIAGELENKRIVLPISLESPSTATMTCSPLDIDHWIDPSESPPELWGLDADVWAGWEETKCWWSTAGGLVTCDDWITTWTAPETQGGDYPLQCAMEDLPKACTHGTRDDVRAYVATEAVGASRAAVRVATAGVAPPHPRAYSAVLSMRHSPGGVPVLSPTLEYPFICGDRRLSNLAYVSNSQGFYKKVEWVATITPPVDPEGPPAYFQWVQHFRGEGVVDGDYKQGPAFEWTDDSPLEDFRTNHMDESGRVYMLDAPGIWAASLDCWSRHKAWICLAWSYEQADPAWFRNELRFGGKIISTNYGNFVVGDWSRHVRIQKEPGEDWTVFNNQ